MSDTDVSARIQTADRWSKVVALLVAMATFVGSLWLTGAPQMSSITAAFTGVGTRFVIPYRVSLSIPAEQRRPISAYPTTGNFHHGAVGGGLVVGSLATVGLVTVGFTSTSSLGLGAVCTGLVYVLLEETLPRS